jgi:serine/threonine protein kinase
MEILQNSWQTLGQYLKDQPFKIVEEVKVVKIIRSILHALARLHRLKIFHRDLKLSNIMVNDRLEIKLIDFGSAYKVGSPDNPSHFGTKGYLAPEIKSFRKNILEPDKLDVWTVGRITQILYLGIQADILRQGQDPGEKADAMSQSHLMSVNMSDFLGRALAPIQSERATVEELLSHPWIN